MAGFISGATGKQGLMTIEQAQTVAETKMREIKARVLESTFGDNKAEGEKFLAANAKKDGVKTLPSGVQYRIIKEGTGAVPADSSLVKVHYEGRLLNDSVFDSSYKRGEPITLRCNQTIKGWTDAMVNMPEGSIWEVYIPQELAYAERQQGIIKPFSVLVFKIELIEVNPKK
jgi:FKBP-type peptidyl-prolyl cis-trans isomerase FklB